jgi:repressor LexA
MFALKVRGDSMEGAHILEGDTIILEQKPPNDGAIVAAFVDGNCTLKRYFVRRGVPFFKS